jgi:ATP-dependent Clp protease ATP-binding subunit ClpA
MELMLRFIRLVRRSSRLFFSNKAQQPRPLHSEVNMIAQELEISLHMAFVEARQARHEFITVEHLLLALLDNRSAVEVLRACACNIEDLRKTLQNFVSDNTPVLPQSSAADTQPTLGFQRVIQRAIMHVQSTSKGKKEVTGAEVLVAIFGEKDSHAVYYLHQQGVTRLDMVNCILHGETVTRCEQGISEQQDAALALDPTALASVLDDLLAQARDGRMHSLVGRAISEACEARHRFVTVEHLLLGVLENVPAAQELRSWGCDVESLQRALVEFLSKVPALPKDSTTRTRAAAGFIRVIERATLRAIVRGVAAPAVASDTRQAGVGDVMGAILEGEEGSPAVNFFRMYTQNLNLLGRGKSQRAGDPT